MKKILLVEDDSSLRVLVSMILKLENHHVTVAEDGQQAIELLKKNEFDLVLLDLFMPILDGTHVLHWLRVEQKLDTPVLIMTAMTDENTEIRIMAAGANSVIKKPLDVDKITQSINQLLNQT